MISTVVLSLTYTPEWTREDEKLIDRVAKICAKQNAHLSTPKWLRSRERGGPIGQTVCKRKHSEIADDQWGKRDVKMTVKTSLFPEKA